MTKRVALVGIAALLVVPAGCTKRQVLPATIAGVGSATMVGGFIYGANQAAVENSFWGTTTGEGAAIGALIFGGMALTVTGILFAVTSTDCGSDEDCWSGDVCLEESATCVDRASLGDRAAAPPPAPEGRPAAGPEPTAEPGAAEAAAGEPASPAP